MKVLIKQAKIISPSAPFNGQIKDILIVDGFITSITHNIAAEVDKIIEHTNLCVSVGWLDIFSNFGDPGFEYKETLITGAKAATTGGFTDVLVLPNTNPVVHSKSQVEYIIQKSTSLAVNIFPIGAITKNTDGKELAEMYDMHQSGAIAFSDGTNSLQSSGVLLKALQYILSFDGTIIQVPDDKTINPQGLINEGIVSTQLGLPGKPALSEELMIARDIELVRYTNSRLHFTGISTQKSIALIKAAKKEGLSITCSVTPYHLYFCDDDLKNYDTNLKVNPPVRTEQDRQALLQALIDGTIDCMASHHFPQNEDNKNCEFEYAKNGMIGLESLFGVLQQLAMGTKEFTIEKLITLLSINPRKIFSIPLPEIKEGAVACLTLFNTTEEYIFDESNIKSISKNSAFIGKKLKGKVIGIINKGMVELN